MFTLSDAEFAGFEMLPDSELADLAIELDMIPGSEIEARRLLSDIIGRILELAQAEGLPFSKYDREDLENLPGDHFRALARSMDWPEEVDGFLKKGRKVYKYYEKHRRRSQVAIMLPLLLGALARHAYEK